MDNKHDKIVEAIRHYLIGDIPGEELQRLMEWVRSDENNRLFFDSICSGKGLEEREQAFRKIDISVALPDYDQRIGYRKARRFSRAWRYVAAVVLPLLVVGLWWVSEREEVASVEVVQAIRPGTAKAVLTLAGGDSVHLHGNMSMSVNNQVAVVSSRVIYTTENGSPREPHDNLLSTPRGGEFNITLSDGSRVYLNSATDLKYPDVFVTETREVHLSGEAYFEVKKDESRPFYVVVGEVRIRVYGTSFNVNTHQEGLIQTVLVEGCIGVQGDTTFPEVRMTPGELTVFSTEGVFVEQKTVDVAPYVAWKEGKFIFENQRLGNIMETLSRWYDVDIRFVDMEAKEHRFTGSVKKYDNIHTILDAISKIIGVEFAINGRTVIVKD